MIGFATVAEARRWGYYKTTSKNFSFVLLDGKKMTSRSYDHDVVEASDYDRAAGTVPRFAEDSRNIGAAVHASEHQ